MMRIKATKSGVLAGSVALAVLVGCQAAPVAPNAPENVTKVGGGATGNMPAPATNPQTPAQPNNPAAQPPASVPSAPLVAPGLDTTTALKISAKNGGKYVTADGTLTADFPPGALSEDAEVRMLPLDTTTRKNSSVYLNGMRFQLDMGNAHIMPGTQVQITSRADKRFLGELQSMYPTDFTPERFSLTQDAKGNWNVSMPLKGPSLTSDPVPTVDPIANDRRGIMHEGTVPLPPPKGSAFKRTSRIEAFCDYAPPPPPPPPVPVCATVKWESDDDSLDGKPAAGAFVRFGTSVPVLNNNGWEENPNLLNPDTLVWTRQNAQGNWEEIVPPARLRDPNWVAPTPTPTAIPTIKPIVAPSGPLPFTLLWNALGDETDAEYQTRLTGMGFRLRTRRNTIAGWRQIVVASNTGSGLPEIMTDSNGSACTWFREGTPVGMTAYITAPIPNTARPGAGTGNVAGVVAGSGSANLTVSKYSPEITLSMQMTDDVNIDSTLRMTVSIDGTRLPGGPIAINQTNSTGFGTKNMTYKFFQLLPDDQPHVFKVEDILSDSGLMAADPRPATMADLKLPKTIQRNGVYNLQVNVSSVAPK